MRKRKPSFIGTEAHCGVIKEILRPGKVTGEGAFCLGLVCAAAEIKGLGPPPRDLLEKAAKCQRADEAMHLFLEWRERA